MPLLNLSQLRPTTHHSVREYSARFDSDFNIERVLYSRPAWYTRIPIQTKPKISVLFNKYIFPVEAKGHSKKRGGPVLTTALFKLSMVSGRKKLEPQFQPRPPLPPHPRRPTPALSLSARCIGWAVIANKRNLERQVGGSEGIYTASVEAQSGYYPAFTHIRHPFAPPTLVYYVLGVEIPAIPTIKPNLPKGVSSRVFIISGGTGC